MRIKWPVAQNGLCMHEALESSLTSQLSHWGTGRWGFHVWGSLLLPEDPEDLSGSEHPCHLPPLLWCWDMTPLSLHTSPLRSACLYVLEKNGDSFLQLQLKLKKERKGGGTQSPLISQWQGLLVIKLWRCVILYWERFFYCSTATTQVCEERACYLLMVTASLKATVPPPSMEVYLPTRV